MLSILIPTFNYNALPLAKILESKALKLGIVFELICMDDGSFSNKNRHNQHINSLSHSKFIEHKKNVGSKANRGRLATLAQYNWLLFIDADSKPKSTLFLSKYVDMCDRPFDAIFGGFAYDSTLKDPNQSLRHYFGKNREEIQSAKRNKNPYKVIISANFLIRKVVFLNVSKHCNQNTYGLDYLFSSQLKSNNISVFHIDNEVWHLGLDKNEEFLKKTQNAVKALYTASKLQMLPAHNISLLKTYNVIVKLGLKTPLKWFFTKLKSKLERHLFRQEPSLVLFDLYRLGYLCSQ